MAYTQPQLDALQAAIAQGALTVKYADKEVTYRSLDDMIRIVALMRADLGQSKPGNRKIQTTYRSGLNAGNNYPNNSDNW